ncbi:MAG: AMP-binding protein, partial [Acidimicrobiales bacterium]
AIVDDAERGRWVATAVGERRCAVVGTDVDLPHGTEPAHLDQSAPDAPAVIGYTSGTTGAPKGAVLSHANLLASAAALALAWRWTAEDRLVLPLPLFHLHGFGVGLHGTLGAGASVVLRQGFAVDDVVDSIRTHHGSLFFGVPTMWSRLAASGRLEELARLRLGVSGSAPLPAELHGAIASSSGQRVIERYGMTETVMNVSNPYDGERRAGTVGFALPGVEVRLAADTDEILLRGPNVFHGYWRRPAATAEAFVDDGWFSSGDVGAFDPDGYLRIVGRRKELIISGGLNVYPREVEDALRTHPAVADAAVVGVADAEWGEQVVAAIEGPGTATEAAAVLAHVAERLAPYKRPKRLVFVDALPRNALGKVVKAEVARLIQPDN